MDRPSKERRAAGAAFGGAAAAAGRTVLAVFGAGRAGRSAGLFFDSGFVFRSDLIVLRVIGFRFRTFFLAVGMDILVLRRPAGAETPLGEKHYSTLRPQ
jgi:hypothetical protein